MLLRNLRKIYATVEIHLNAMATCLKFAGDNIGRQTLQ